MTKIALAQIIILLAGNLFAWFNFFRELNNWLQGRACTTGCAAGLVNPFLTPCFYGAMVFAIALVVSIIMLRKVNKANR